MNPVTSSSSSSSFFTFASPDLQTTNSQTVNVDTQVSAQMPSTSDKSSSSTAPVPKVTNPQLMNRFSSYTKQIQEMHFTEADEQEVLGLQAKIAANKHGQLDLSALKENGFLPTHKVVIDTVTYYCSDLFLFHEHQALIILLKRGNNVFARLGYHSRSQGVWRVAVEASKITTTNANWLQPLGIFTDEEEKKPKEFFRFGKGGVESTTVLPLALVWVLNKHFDFKVQAKEYPSSKALQADKAEDEEEIPSNQLLETINVKNEQLFEVKTEPFGDLDNQMPANIGLHPDFTQCVAQNQRDLPCYGKVQMKIFASKDKTLLFLFIELEDGKVFLSSVECIESDINSYGVRKRAMSLKKMDAPLLEYASQVVHGYGSQSKHALYRDNWDFVRELSIIALYYKAQNRQIPPKLDISSSSTDLPVPTITSSQLVSSFSAYTKQIREMTFSKVDEKEVLSLQSKIVANNNGQLALSALKEDGYLPTHKVVIGNVSYYCSDLFMFQKRQALIALVESGNQIFPRLFYRSYSQGVWRVSVDAYRTTLTNSNFMQSFGVFTDEDENKPKEFYQFGRGGVESTTALPLALVCALNKLFNFKVSPQEYPSRKALQGKNAQDTQEEIPPEKVLETINLKKGKPPFEVKIESFGESGNQMPKDTSRHPDFTQCVAQYQCDLPCYGNVNMRIFASKDHKLLFLFNELKDKRVFLSSVECIESEINSYGVRKAAVNLEKMDSPLLEYGSQIESGSHSQSQDATYQDNWNFIRKLPIIWSYYEAFPYQSEEKK